jgi:hypothetical protein
LGIGKTQHAALCPPPLALRLPQWLLRECLGHPIRPPALPPILARAWRRRLEGAALECLVRCCMPPVPATAAGAGGTRPRGDGSRRAEDGALRRPRQPGATAMTGAAAGVARQPGLLGISALCVKHTSPHLGSAMRVPGKLLRGCPGVFTARERGPRLGGRPPGQCLHRCRRGCAVKASAAAAAAVAAPWLHPANGGGGPAAAAASVAAGPTSAAGGVAAVTAPAPAPPWRQPPPPPPP